MPTNNSRTTKIIKVGTIDKDMICCKRASGLIKLAAHLTDRQLIHFIWSAIDIFTPTVYYVPYVEPPVLLHTLI